MYHKGTHSVFIGHCTTSGQHVSKISLLLKKLVMQVRADLALQQTPQCGRLLATCSQ